MNQFPFEEARSVASDIYQVAMSPQAGELYNAIEKFKKSQAVRLLDVAIIGPIMIYYGWKGRLNSFERVILLGMGAGTILYNWQNFRRNKEWSNFITQYSPANIFR